MGLRSVDFWGMVGILTQVMLECYMYRCIDAIKIAEFKAAQFVSINHFIKKRKEKNGITTNIPQNQSPFGFSRFSGVIG
ncbi:hypothetical protein KVE05_05790 [Helicobacter pylori]|nr:hypothetical protein KVE05_05790 [Helicobacter pylori]